MQNKNEILQAKNQKKILALARQVIRVEAGAVANLADRANQAFFECTMALHECEGGVVFAGIGKSALMAELLAATFNAAGIPAHFLHAADALHGDAGMLRPKDAVVCLSNSGETPEIKEMVQLVKPRVDLLVALCGNENSYLVRQAHHFVNTSVKREACPHNLMPTASLAAQMAMGHALALCLRQLRKHGKSDFASLHPGGSLGKQLNLQVGQVCAENPKPQVSPDATARELIVEMTSKRLGATAVVHPNGQLAGIITDGDLRRALQQFPDFDRLHASDMMTPQPKTATAGSLAIDALALMRQHKITQLILVAENGNYTGMVHMHDLLREGIC